MRLVRPIGGVRVWSRNFAHARSFAQDAQSSGGIEISTFQTAREAVEGADIICTVTAATAPVLEGAWLKPGVHVNAVGSSVPPFRELDTEAVVRARLFVDSKESALREPDDIRIPLSQGLITESHIIGELAELVSSACAGRTAASDVTLFKSVGLAIEDLAAAQAIYERAIAQGRGVIIEL